MPGTPERTTTVKEWLTSLIGGAPFGILAFDLQGVCTLANVAAGDAFDTAPDRLVDRLSIEIIAEWPELESAMLNSVLPAAEEGGRFDYDCERVVRGERSYNVRGRTIVDGMLMTIDDITAEVRMRRDQDLLVEHLEATNRELAEFAYICAHDMKSPVDSLVGLVDDMASFDNMPPEISPAFAIVQRSVKALDKNVRSVNKILEVKKTIGAGSGAGDLQAADRRRLDRAPTVSRRGGGSRLRRSSSATPPCACRRPTCEPWSRISWRTPSSTGSRIDRCGSRSVRSTRAVVSSSR